MPRINCCITNTAVRGNWKCEETVKVYAENGLTVFFVPCSLHPFALCAPYDSFATLRLNSLTAQGNYGRELRNGSWTSGRTYLWEEDRAVLGEVNAPV